jgi:glycosyltransferase involved in cell wall biosynthesis
MGKKKILYHSNYSKVLSGFGKNARNLLRYLCSTGKYEVVELSNGVISGNNELSKLPWKAVGGIPSDPEVVQRINQDPNLSRSAQYGSLLIDDIIKEEKPDIYLGVEDIWAMNNFVKKPWWNKINCMVWTTLDSLPILPDAVKCAKKIKNYYVWASFAEKALNELGHDHVKTLHGAIDTSNFKRLDHGKRLELRQKFGINNSDFIIGFVFRNQLRKSVPNLLEGFRLFKQEFPNSGAKLLLHTNFSEGWNIPDLVNEKKIDPKDILCTYYCPKCKNYIISPFSGQGLDCPVCGSKKSLNTISITDGVDEHQLNEIYNLMDVYCHPFTSGGQEIPIQEAKLTELITLVTNYSCGTDCCNSDSGGFPLEWSEYREPGTQFIKASTFPSSIFKNLKKVYNMDLLKRSSMGKKARQFVIDNYSIDIIGKKLENILDDMPEIDYDFSFEKELRDPNYDPPEIKDDSDWLINIYENILKVELDHTDEGHKHWMSVLSKGGSRNEILKYFRSIANQENEKISNSNLVDFKDVIKNEGNKKALFVCNSSSENLLLVSCLFEDFKKHNPEVDIYLSTGINNHDIVSCNPHIYMLLAFQPEFSSENLMLNDGKKGYFDFYYNFDSLLQNKSYLNIQNLSYPIYE